METLSTKVCSLCAHNDRRHFSDRPKIRLGRSAIGMVGLRRDDDTGFLEFILFRTEGYRKQTKRKGVDCMETRQLIKMLGGAIAVTLLVLLIAALMPDQAKAEMDSNGRNPGKDKIEQKVTEFGTAMKGWAIAFGAGVEKNATESKTAFLNDIERLKNSEFFQYQKKGFEQGKEQLARNREQIQQLPSKIKEGTANLFATIAKGLDAVLGGNNDRKTEK